MARISFTGLDKYLEQLNKIGNASTAICKMALYDGAAVVGNAIRAEVEALPTTDRNGDPQQILEYEKEGLLEGLGVAKMKSKNGVIYTRIDFDGYNRLKSKKYPSGHPNSMVARAINSGTSKRPKNPFMLRAVRKAREKANAAMAAKIDDVLYKFMKK